MLPIPFSNLPSSFQTELTFSERDLIFRMGDRSDGIFHLLDGEVHMTRVTESGDSITIHRAFSGESFAEASLFSDSYHCYAVAVRPCKTVKIDRLKILNQIETDPVFATNLTAHLARQVQNYRRILELRAIRSAEDRVYAGIVEGWFQSTVLAFAGQLGLTHEATYRALTALTKSGRVVKAGRGAYRVATNRNS